MSSVSWPWVPRKEILRVLGVPREDGDADRQADIRIRRPAVLLEIEVVVQKEAEIAFSSVHYYYYHNFVLYYCDYY